MAEYEEGPDRAAAAAAAGTAMARWYHPLLQIAALVGWGILLVLLKLGVRLGSSW
jgi:hypothetical protein